MTTPQSNAPYPSHATPPPVDADPKQRPGVPMELEPHAVGSAHWTEPDRQPDPGNVLKRADLTQLTPVFGTAAPPRGLSGVMRRAAYRIPEHRTSHWLLLMFADRVDAIEHGSPKALALMVPLALGGIAALARRGRATARKRRGRLPSLRTYLR